MGVTMTNTTTTTSITFEPNTNTYRASHDWQSDDRITETIVRAIAIVTNTPPTDFEPLYESIDPDALNQLFTRPNGDSPQNTSQVSFSYNDCTVQVDATGTIEITSAKNTNPITAPVPEALRDR